MGSTFYLIGYKKGENPKAVINEEFQLPYDSRDFEPCERALLRQDDTEENLNSEINRVTHTDGVNYVRKGCFYINDRTGLAVPIENVVNPDADDDEENQNKHAEVCSWERDAGVCHWIKTHCEDVGFNPKGVFEYNSCRVMTLEAFDELVALARNILPMQDKADKDEWGIISGISDPELLKVVEPFIIKDWHMPDWHFFDALTTLVSEDTTWEVDSLRNDPDFAGFIFFSC